jgi:hypothetical protein
MAQDQTTARARVQLTIELDAGSTWGNDCTVNQIYDQAGRESVNHVERIFHEAKENIVIVGKPKVTAVFAKRE